MYKKSGPSIEPYGTPALTLVVNVENSPFKNYSLFSDPLKNNIISLKACQIRHFVLIFKNDT